MATPKSHFRGSPVQHSTDMIKQGNEKAIYEVPFVDKWASINQGKDISLLGTPINLGRAGRRVPMWCQPRVLHCLS